MGILKRLYTKIRRKPRTYRDETKEVLKLIARLRLSAKQCVLLRGKGWTFHSAAIAYGSKWGCIVILVVGNPANPNRVIYIPITVPRA